MENIITFAGIIVFTALSATGPVEAIIPRLGGEGGIPAHDTFIMFKPGTAVTDGPTPWPIHSVTTVDHERLEYVDLRGGTIRFNSGGTPMTEIPAFLPRLNDDCCGMMGGLRAEYRKHGDPQYTSGHVILNHSERAEMVKTGGRVDTQITLQSYGPLVITRELRNGDDVMRWTLTFKQRADVLIANVPLDDIKYGPGHGHHFHAYYRMVTRGFFCSKSDAPSSDEKCRSRMRNAAREPKVTGVPPLGADIDCSNSGYP